MITDVQIRELFEQMSARVRLGTASTDDRETFVACGIALYGSDANKHRAREILNERAKDEEDDDCNGHPAGAFDPMGRTVYCDGSCRSTNKRAKAVR